MAVLFDILTYVQSQIANRGLGITPANIVIQKRPVAKVKDLPVVAYPAIIIAPWGAEGLDPMGGTISQDDVEYPIVVAIVANDQHDQKIGFNQYLTWRQSIRQLFHEQPLPNNVTVTVNDTSYASGKLSNVVYVKPLDIVDRDRWDEVGKFVSGMILTCVSREPRG